MFTKQEIESIEQVIRDSCMYEPISSNVIIRTVWNLQKANPGWTVAYKPYFGENDEDPSGMANNAVDFLFIRNGETYLFHVGPDGVFSGAFPGNDSSDEEMKKTYKISIIEWYEDDVGQYKDKLPRFIEKFQMKWRKFATEDEEGEAILNELERIYKVKPVLISWEIPEADEA